MRLDNSHFRVLVVSPLASVAGRMKLNGIYRFLSEGHDWEIDLVRNEGDFTLETFRTAVTGGYHGMFIGWRESPEMRRLHARLAIPSVLFDCDASDVLRQNPHAVLVRDDATTIAHEAARHFIAQGRAVSYGFVPTRQPTFWSTERGEAFVDEMRRRHRDVDVYRAERHSLADWLAAHDKPAAIFCASDDEAASVLQASRALGLSVPGDLAVLGINNDEQICEHTRPRLSSVAVDFEALGYCAAHELHAMMLRRRRPDRNVIPIRSAQVCARASTAREPSAGGALVQDAITYIMANATRRLTPTDVTRHVRVSRRLLDLRFREIADTSVQATIRKYRLRNVCQLLRTTDKPLAEIALACDYSDANNLKNQFKRAFGLSPRAWRLASKR